MIGAGAFPASKRPLIIAHRGASAYRPEHTLAAYALAIDQGADFIEPDLVVTRDGVLVARHDNELSGSTDVADHPEFRHRLTRKCVDGKSVDGWFVEDFTLRQLKTLRAREPFPAARASSAAFDGCFEIPTLQDILDLLLVDDGVTGPRKASDDAGINLRCGLYPELKHPTFYEQRGFDTPRLLLEALQSRGIAERRQQLFIQSFEISTLKKLRQRTGLPLVQLLDLTGGPYDSTHTEAGKTYRDMMTPAGLAEIAAYADAIGPAKVLVDPGGDGSGVDRLAALLKNAHRAGLLVHVWTFRSENRSRPARPACSGLAKRDQGEQQLDDEIRRYLAAGVDGLFTDNPDVAVLLRDAILGDGETTSIFPRMEEP